jgi:hypothetical protein
LIEITESEYTEAFARRSFHFNVVSIFAHDSRMLECSA